MRIKRDLRSWLLSQSSPIHGVYAESVPGQETREKGIAAMISRCTKELSLDQEAAVAVKNRRKQEYLDQLAEI